MGTVPRLKISELRSILNRFGVSEDPSRGKGGHTYFFKKFADGTFGMPMPTRRDVLPCYVSQARKKFRLRAQDGVSDEEFYGRK
jgi:hypothetical protein